MSHQQQIELAEKEHRAIKALLSNMMKSEKDEQRRNGNESLEKNLAACYEIQKRIMKIYLIVNQ